MAILRFRVYWEEDDSIYRDIALRHTQSFFELHGAILKSFEFDSKHRLLFTAATITGSVAGKFLWKNMKRNIRQSL